MSQTRAICTHKGGTGKTVTALSLAAGLANDGQRCLLVDLDPQAHSTIGIGLDVYEPSLKDFFERHWNEHAVGKEAPTWSGVWNFKGSVPDNDKQGCYALLTDEGSVIYIGVGGAKGDGLGKRISQYWKVADGGHRVPIEDRPYEPTEKWSQRKVGQIRIISFPEPRGYLAYALESYLIARLRPQFNSALPGASDLLAPDSP